MIQSNAPMSDWGFALKYAVFLLNRTPSVRLQDHSPYELWHQRPFDFNPPAAFGNRVLAKVFIKRKGRLDHDAKPCAFLGLSEQSKAALVRCLKTKKVQLTNTYKVVPDIFVYLDCKRQRPISIEGNDQDDGQDPQTIWSGGANQNPRDLSLVDDADFHGGGHGENYESDPQNLELPDVNEQNGHNSNYSHRQSGRDRTLSDRALDNLASLSVLPMEKARERQEYQNPLNRREALGSFDSSISRAKRSRQFPTAISIVSPKMR